PAARSRTILIATSRCSRASRARYTFPMPPAPSRRNDFVPSDPGARNQRHRGAVVRWPDYTRVVPSSSLQALLMRAGAALVRGRGAEAVQLLAPALRSSTLTRDEELAVRSMLAEAALLQDD